MKHLTELNDFRKQKGNKLVTEMVHTVGNDYLVVTDIPIPKSLVNAFIKKVADDSGQDIKAMYGDQYLAEKIVEYVKTNLINIDNLPTSIVLGEDYNKGVQVQPQAQLDGTQPVQPVQDDAQSAAAQIGAQENGVQGQVQPQGQVQTQGQGTQIQTQATQTSQGQATTPQGSQEI